MKKHLLLLIGTACILGAVTVPAANIAWVSFHSDDNTPSANAAAAGFTNAPDIGYTKLLAANGHTVTRFVTVDSLDTFPDLINALNTNDLVILSRSVPSGHYQQQNETGAWNTNITKPLMCVNGYLTRGGTGGGSRLGLTTGETMTDVNVFPVRLRVNGPGHPIFKGVALDSQNLMVNGFAQRAIFTNATTGVTTNQNGISINNNSIIAGGTVLAVVGTAGSAGLNGMAIGEIPAGATTTHFSDVLSAKRLIFLTGSRESGITSEGAGIYDLLSEGEKMFLNAVKYLTTPQVPVCTVPLVGATNLAAGDTWTFAPGTIGDAPLSCQWYQNGQALPTGTNAVLVFTNLAFADAGSYYLIVSNTLGRATSTVATLSFIAYLAPNLTNGIISYWPLDTVLGNKTPDLVSGYDMTLVNMSAANLVPGKWGQAFSFDNLKQTILQRVNAWTGEDLPIYNKPNFTVSLWVQGWPQSDHRVFCEGSTTNGNPLFDIGTHNSATAPDGTVDSYIRSDGGATIGDHRHSTRIAFDGDLNILFPGNWHHIAYVQRDIGGGQMKAQMFIDGNLDPIVLGPIRPLTPNTTTIGGILRASASAWFTGNIDEVAVWSRALSPTEIGYLLVTPITNAPVRPQPLAIKSFTTDFAAAAKGDSIPLRWEVSRDATQVTIDQGVGDVTAKTVYGTGTNLVTLTNATRFILTVKRGTDTLSATTSVGVVEGIAPGWTLLDNFDLYSPGSLAGTGYWVDPLGNSAQVVDYKGNRVVKNTSGNSVAFLPLQSVTVKEGQNRTLFFRLIATNAAASGSTNLVGLTDKSQRNYGDEFSNVGPVVYPTALTNTFAGITTNAYYLGARNGVLGPVDFNLYAMSTGVVYNVWIDVTNNPLDAQAADIFSVWVQQDGDATRTLLFDGYASDRDLNPFNIDPVLGGPLPDLNKLIVIGNNAAGSPFFDDFYLSKSGYLSTVPRAYGYTGPAVPVVDAKLGIRWSGSQIELLWTNGRLQEASSVSGPFTPVSGAAPPSYKVTPSAAQKYYRLSQ